MKNSVTPLSLPGILALGISLGLGSCSSVGMPATNASPTEASLLTKVSVSTTGMMDSDTARYEIRFVPTWNPATHPVEYPFPHAKQGFMTPAIGATHNSSYAIFAPGVKPTTGLEKLSETGKPALLDAEIMAAISANKVGSVIKFSDGSPGPVHPSVATTFEIANDAPLVSFVGMIAPSPDWFYGVSSVQLYKHNRWVPGLSVPVYVWDSGGDAGATYLADDKDLNPKQPTRKADTAHFNRDGQTCPVGYFVFKLVPANL